MDTRAVFSLSRRFLSRYKHAAIRVTRRVLPEKKQMLFIFGGRTQYWPAMGRELYQNETVFRDAIHKCDQVITEWQFNSILPHFEGEEKDQFLADESMVALTISAIQIATADLLKSKGIFPNATLGISLGEGPAVYAAGGLQLKDALKMGLSGAFINRLEGNNYIPLYLQCSMQEGFAVSKKIHPLFISPIYEAGERGILALCHKDKKDEAISVLNNEGIKCSVPHNGTTWPYHTHIIEKHRETLIRFTKDIEPFPLQCDYYSTQTGGVIPKGSIIENEFWFTLQHRPVLTHSALLAAQQAGLKIITHAGPSSFPKGQLQRSGGNALVTFDTMSRNEPEQQVFKDTLQKIAATRRAPAAIVNANHESAAAFINGFSLYNPLVQQDPYPYFRFLRKYGNVHFLPAHGAWLVLDYDDIEMVLKQPQIFSSTLHKTFDECLVGSDPPEHTLVRSLLQPLFSQRVLTELGDFTAAYSKVLLEKMKGRTAFNLVDEFSLPLAQAVVAKFLGLTDEEAQLLKNCITNHVYSMEYLENMRQFFHRYLESNNSLRPDSAAALLLKGVEEKKLSFDGAVKLLRLLWVAGMTTTSMLLTTAINELLKDETLAEKLGTNDQLLSKFIDECLRLEAPESELRRITTCETQLGDKAIPAGAVLLLSLRAANRDEKYFENADSVLLDRPAKRHLSFGGGYHYCLGVGIAKMEAKYALKAVLTEAPQMKLSENRKAIYFPSPHFRGLSELIVSV